MKIDKAVAEMLFNSPPEIALEYFGGKKIIPKWQNVQNDAHSRSFIIAGETRYAVLKDVYVELHNALENGLTLEQYKENTLSKLQTSGWLRGRTGWDPSTNKPIYSYTEDTTRDRLERIYTNNLNAAYAVGNYSAIMDGEFEFVQYLAVLDNRTRESHRDLHGRIFATNDPALKYFAPPNGYGCRCELVGVTEDEVDNPAAVRAAAKAPNRVREVTHVDIQTSRATKRHELDLGGGIRFQAAEGWDYNPAQAFWEQRVMRANTEPDRNFRIIFENINGGVEVFNAHRPLPPFDADKMITDFDLTQPNAEEKLLQIFLDKNGGKDGIVKVKDPKGVERFFSVDSFIDRKKNDYKISKRGRHRFLNYMPEAVSDPDLVIVKNQMAGMPSRTMYIKGYMDGRFVRGLVVVVDGENVNQIITAYTVNTEGNFPKIPKRGDRHDQKTATEIDIKNIFAIISDRAKHGTEDMEFKLIYPEEIDLLK
jgi:SPP1 gp7 family putative phage head morphogenesis protein